LNPSPDPKSIWQTVLATAYQEYTAAKNNDRSHRDGVVVTPVEIVSGNDTLDNYPLYADQEK
jgi:hypothetical protein